jgi:hypothetical protein
VQRVTKCQLCTKVGNCPSLLYRNLTFLVAAIFIVILESVVSPSAIPLIFVSTFLLIWQAKLRFAPSLVALWKTIKNLPNTRRNPLPEPLFGNFAQKNELSFHLL